MLNSSDIRFLKTHEWARREGSVVVVGISEFAVEQLNREIVFVELPDAGRTVRQTEPCGVIEAVKAAFDLYAPMSGKVIEVNEAVGDRAELVAEDPFEAGWIFKIEFSDESEWQNLLSSEDYKNLIESGEPH